MRALAILVVLAGLLVAAPTASAAFGISAFSAQPVSKAAGANSDLSVSFSVTDPNAGLKDLTVHLPPGLIGNPLATPTCSETKLKADNCPAASDVGDATNKVNVKPLGLLPIPLTVSGQVYNVEPRAGEPARFGIVLDPSPVPGLGAVLPKIVLQQTAKLRNGDFGLDTALKDIPNSAKIGGTTTPLEVTGVALTLKGKVAGKGFLRNPTSCGVQTVGIDADAYDNQTATSQDQFTTTNCGALPFSPKFSAKIHQLTSDLANPVELTTTISQTIEEAGLKRAVVTLPGAILADGSVLAVQCPAAEFDAGNCPDNTQVGEATAASPLLEKPLRGGVFILAGAGLPELGVALEGGLSLKVTGSLGGDPSGHAQVTFDDLPDIPLSGFSLSFSGGPGGLNIATQSPCEPPPFAFHADFLSHSTSTRSVDVDADSTCPGSNPGKGKPRARVRIAKLRSGEPRLAIRMKAGPARIKKASVKFPRGLEVGARKKLRKGTSVAGGSVRGKGHALKIKAKGGGVDKIEARLAKGAIVAGHGVKAKELKPFKVRITDADGKSTKLSVSAR